MLATLQEWVLASADRMITTYTLNLRAPHFLCIFSSSVALRPVTVHYLLSYVHDDDAAVGPNVIGCRADIFIIRDKL